MRLFPELFPKDENGNIREPDCGLWCPPGWQHIVETLCRSISWRVNKPREVQKWRALYAVQTFLYKKIFVPINTKFYRWADPCESLHWKDGKRETWIMIRPGQRKELEEKHPTRTKLVSKLSKISAFFRPRMRFKKVPTPPVTIDQVKEKFGTMRFYYSGGDHGIASIVAFAEDLTNHVCERTGAPGTMCKRGGWYKTLSPDEAEKTGYSKAE